MDAVYAGFFSGGLTRRVRGVALADRTTALTQETLALEILLANRAGEALAVVVVIHGFNPTIARLDGVAACETLGREQLVPVSLTVGESVLQVEVAVAKQASAVSTGEAFRVELLTDGVQAISLDAFLTPGADWRQVALEASLAVELFLLFHEADVSQRAPAVIHGAHEVLRTPGHAQGGHELAPNLAVACSTHGDTAAWSSRL